MINNAEFSKRLQKVIDYYSESASSFAEKVGVQRSSISHILSGRNKPSLEFVLKVLDTFPEVELYWLMNGKGHFPKSISIPKIEKPPTPKKVDQDLFTNSENLDSEIPKNPELKNVEAFQNLNHNISKGKKIDRIVIFYSDGSFSNYEN